MPPMPPGRRRRPSAPRRCWGCRRSRSIRQSRRPRRVAAAIARPRSARISLKRQEDRFGHQAGHLRQEIVRRLGLGRRRSHLIACSRPVHRAASSADPMYMPHWFDVKRSPIRSRYVASFVRVQQALSRVARHQHRPVRLPPEYLAQPPSSRLNPARAVAASAKYGCSRFVRRRERRSRAPRAHESAVLGHPLSRAVAKAASITSTSGGANEPYQESSSALSDSARTRAAGHVAVSRRVIGQSSVEPGQPFANSTSAQPY